MRLPAGADAPAMNETTGFGTYSSMNSAASSSVAPLIESGDLVPLITTAPQRLPGLPDVPTFAERGHADATLNIWMGFFLPASTPQPITQRFTDAVAQASRSPALKTAIEHTGMIFEYGDPARVNELLHQEHAKVAKLAELVDLGT